MLLPLTFALVVGAPVLAQPAPELGPVLAVPRAASGAAGPVVSDALLEVRSAEAVSAAPPKAEPDVARPVGAARPVVRAAARPTLPRVARPNRARPRASQPSAYAPGWEQRRGEAALRLIRYPWRELGWEISFHPARRGLLGLAYEPDRHIYVFVRRGQTVAELAFTVAHEIGHAHDFELGTRETRERWLALRGIDAGTPWTGCEGCSDLETPAGDFAEVFAVWQVGPVDFRSRMADLPRGERLRALSQEFRAPREVRAQ